ncbi:MAG: murein L,D-transpeptidase family protein [Devosia sp.]
MKMIRTIASVLTLLAMTLVLAACNEFTTPDEKANQPLASDLAQKIKDIDSTLGAPMMMRIIKQESVMEVWKQTNSGKYALLTTFKICAYSGGFGPKIVEGDRQAPEGYYDITPALMNKNSNYYLAFNTGFPNKFDKSYGRTGANLMVHGDCSSSGCYAMTDKEIAQIFVLVREAFKGGSRSVPLEIFPFRMTPDNLAKMNGNQNMAFWQNIKTGYDTFALTQRPPTWDVCDKKYVFNATSPDGQPLDAAVACPVLTTDPTLTAELAAKATADDAALAEAVKAAGGTIAPITVAAPIVVPAAAPQQT